MNTSLFTLHTKLHDLISREEGQDLVEYTLVVALVVFGCTACLKVLAIAVGSAFHGISSNLGSYDI
jgi:pilus assembly protein Flp/PilA